MKGLDCTPNEVTGRVLAVMAWCLEHYFGHTSESAVATIRNYYERNSGVHDDHLYQHEGAYWMALRIHFIDDLGGSPGDFHMWRVKQGYKVKPADVPDIFDDTLFDS